jgi:hypothetical protein
VTKRSYIAAFTLLVLQSCVRDKPQAPVQSVSGGGGKGVFVINEGNFFSSNASLSYFEPLSGAVTTDIYRERNNSALGDVAQSMGYFNGSYYLVINNSGRVIKCDAGLRKQAELTLPSPRYMLHLSPAKAYVSDFTSDAIAVIDLPSFSQRTSIRCPGWTEQMLMLYGKVFVTNMKREYLYVIDAKEDRLTDSVYVGLGAGSLVLDRNDRLWVLSSGDEFSGIKGRLSRINPLVHTIEWTRQFQGGSPRYLCANSSGDTLYFIDQHIFRMPVGSGSLPQDQFISGTGRTWYGIGVNPRDGRIYLSDALDYLQRSNIYYYDSRGVELGFFKAGINASGFYFE